jgi:hypothetical protein
MVTTHSQLKAFVGLACANVSPVAFFMGSQRCNTWTTELLVVWDSPDAINHKKIPYICINGLYINHPQMQAVYGMKVYRIHGL